jgi:hypothetical protein
LLIFNACLQLEQLPKQWLNSNIWPIPKKDKYTYELNTTRPITLIDHTRKIFTKIITNRLSNILDRNKILSPHNYAAFPQQSTLQPISQLTSIIEHASTTKQEIWILLQDMSKAFDSIHIPTLVKALQRIKLPTSIINLLFFLLLNHTNQVITDYGLTRPYSVEDGIDQGETFSPILWRIYYDPLISRIHNEHSGYQATIQTLSMPIHLQTSVIAYMDDSLWVAPNKSSLMEILSTANSFYKFAMIQVNPTKSILATNTTSEDRSILFNEESLTAIDKTKPFKYLGAWFSIHRNPTNTQKIIISEALSCATKLQKSFITEKQAIYIINNIIIPRISYCLNSAFLSKTQLSSLNRTYTNIVKQKAKLSQSLPNSFLYHPDIYSLKNFVQIQNSHLSSTLLRNLNQPLFDTSFLKI